MRPSTEALCSLFFFPLSVVIGLLWWEREFAACVISNTRQVQWDFSTTNTWGLDLAVLITEVMTQTWSVCVWD